LDRHARRLGELAHLWDPAPRGPYAYVLDLYLGDGYLARHPRTLCLQVTLDAAYPGIIGECARAISKLMPRNPVRVIPQPSRCVDVMCYSTLWPDLIPQHGPGPKHQRPIILEGWQQLIVEAEPRAFIRGLFHSEGRTSKTRYARSTASTTRTTDTSSRTTPATSASSSDGLAIW